MLPQGQGQDPWTRDGEQARGLSYTDPSAQDSKKGQVLNLRTVSFGVGMIAIPVMFKDLEGDVGEGNLFQYNEWSGRRQQSTVGALKQGWLFACSNNFWLLSAPKAKSKNKRTSVVPVELPGYIRIGWQGQRSSSCSER